MLTSPGILYVVATPIGNLGDWTFRAVEIAKAVDAVACEDTRVTQKLLRHYGISTPRLSYHDHNGDRQRPKLLAMLREGKRIALMSDAGTPLISDPGYKLVREAQEQGIHVVSVPGPSSVTAALSIAGLPSDRFYFVGFLPSKREARRKEIAALKLIPATLAILESPNRLVETVRDLHDLLGDREAAVAREMTKCYEEVIRGRLADLPDAITEDKQRGELVLLVATGAQEDAAPADVEKLLRALLKTHSVKDAARLAAEITGISRNMAYEMALRYTSGEVE